MENEADYDVGIIGAGPAGSGLACYLAKAGVSCVVFERDLFPRPHVGESLVPSSTRVFKDLDFIKVMEDANPPEDLRTYNDEFVQYLEDSVADPTSLLTRKPPLPEEDVQRRLAQKELSVDECKDGTYFSRDLPAEE